MLWRELEEKNLVLKERALIGEIIAHLAEIETRKLYCDLMYHSLYDYCTEELGYTNDQAYRRISAMRLSKQLPQIKTKLENGSISLSSANMFSTLIKDSKMEKGEQVEVIRLSVSISKETLAKIEQVKSLYSKKNRNGESLDLDKVLDMMAQVALIILDGKSIL